MRNKKIVNQCISSLGGQKAAAWVALIFALSTIEPPPFYISDEIDAALEPNYKVNLANKGIVQK